MRAGQVAPRLQARSPRQVLFKGRILLVNPALRGCGPGKDAWEEQPWPSLAEDTAEMCDLTRLRKRLIFNKNTKIIFVV
jgi:hypothetical protein